MGAGCLIKPKVLIVFSKMVCQLFILSFAICFGISE
jgi:hypothetical protein